MKQRKCVFTAESIPVDLSFFGKSRSTGTAGGSDFSTVFYCQQTFSTVNSLSYVSVNINEDRKKNKHNTELQRTDPGTKVRGEFSTKGRIYYFST